MLLQNVCRVWEWTLRKSSLSVINKLTHSHADKQTNTQLYRLVQMAMFPRSDAALVTALRLRPCGGVVVPVNHSLPFNVLVYPGVVFIWFG